MEAKLKILLALLLFFNFSAQAWTGVRMRKSSTPSIVQFVRGSTLLSIRPKQKWQYAATGGNSVLTFDIQSGSGTTTAAGLYTAAASASGSTVVRVKDSGAGQDTTTVSNFLPTVTMANSAVLVTGEPQGVLLDSGGASGNYGNQEVSYVLIHSDSAKTAITLSFDTFITESNYDYLKIYDGDSTAGTVVGNFSGPSLPGPVTATSGNMLIQFTSDGADNFAGFSARWAITPTALSWTHPSALAVETSKDERLTVTGGVGPFIYSVTSGSGTIDADPLDPFVGIFHAPSSPGTTVVKVTDALNNTYTETLTVAQANTLCAATNSNAQYGVIYDPGGPSSIYSSNQNCGFVITPISAGSGIQLNLEYLETESGYDKLYIYDGVNTSGTLLATYSGVMPATAVVKATSGSMYVRFVSDSAINLAGFRAIWKVLP